MVSKSVGKVGVAVCLNLGSFKKGAVKSTMPHMGQSSKMPNSPVFLQKSIVIYQITSSEGRENVAH